MATTQAGIVLRHLSGLAAGQPGDAPDGQLLERFLGRREEAAFTALVRRHGPMVLGVCRRVLHNHHDAEDAFQAAFLTLARKARSIGKGSSLGSWLYQVAYHTAIRARARVNRVVSVSRGQPSRRAASSWVWPSRSQSTTGTCSTASPPGATSRRSRSSCGVTGRWCWASAGAPSATGTTPRTPSRPPS